MGNSNEATCAATVAAITDRHRPRDPSWDTRPAMPPMIVKLHNHWVCRSSDLDPALGIVASVLVSVSLYGVIGAVIAYFILR